MVSFDNLLFDDNTNNMAVLTVKSTKVVVIVSSGRDTYVMLLIKAGMVTIYHQVNKLRVTELLGEL